MKEKNKCSKIISIIGGTGMMGQMFLKVFKEKGYTVLVAGRNTKISFKEAAKRGDLVIVCVPISATEEVVKEIAPYVRKEAILSDFTSIKMRPCEAMLTYSKSQVVGAHPVFGPIPDIKGQPFVVCPERVSKQSYVWFKELFISIGLNVIEMTAEEHDKQMAVIQCLNHLSNLSFANSIYNIKFDLNNTKLFSPAFVLKLGLIKRMLSQSPSLYAEIETYNPYAKTMAKNYLHSLNEIKENIDRGDKDILENKIKKLQQYFSVLNQDRFIFIEKIPDLIKKPFDFFGKLVILGPEYSYSHLLAKKIHPSKKFIFCNNIEEIFKLVHDGKIKNGLVPIENMLSGSVRESVVSLKKYRIKINNLYNFAIHHCFASKSNNFKKIISKEQGIAQCSKFLDSYRKKGIEIIETTSTSKALEIASLDKDYAAIGSIEGAKYFKLEILKDKIENNHNNVTSFISISKKENHVSSKVVARTSILITPPKDHPGLLYEALHYFNKNNINLTKIESIPTGEKMGEYIFYIEFIGNLSEDSVQMALDTIKALYNVYVLGSYEVENIT